MTCLFTWMTTCFFCLATGLLTCFLGAFALARFVARVAAVMGAALEFPATNLAASDIFKPAWLVLQRLLAAHAAFHGQERALWTGLIVLVAVMLHLWVTTALRPLAVKPARWWLGTTR